MEKAMSYSFQLRRPTKTQAKQAVAAKFIEIVHQQACHTRDMSQAIAAANAIIDLVRDDDTSDVSVIMNGSLCGRWEDSDMVAIESANVNVTAYLVARKAK
jgi:hypothetical protein